MSEKQQGFILLSPCQQEVKAVYGQIDPAAVAASTCACGCSCWREENGD